MVRDFLEFLRALWREWVPLLTGGSLIAVLALWQMSGRKVSPSADWLVVGLTLMVAAFLSWRKEWIQLGRGLVTENPQELTRIARKNTEIQAKAYLAKYIGRRIIIRGKLYDVSTVLPGWHRVHIRTGDIRTQDDILVHSGIALGAFRIFSVLPRGAEISIAGRITAVEPYSLTLAACDLLELHQPPTTTPDAQSPTP